MCVMTFPQAVDHQCNPTLVERQAVRVSYFSNDLYSALL